MQLLADCNNLFSVNKTLSIIFFVAIFIECLPIRTLNILFEEKVAICNSFSLWDESVVTSSATLQLYGKLELDKNPL